MKDFVIFLVLIGILVPAFAFEPEPVGINIVEYGIFDPNDNNTNRLKVGEKYNIKSTFESELDESIYFTYFVKVIDKNKRINEIVDEFRISGTLSPGELQSTSFVWTPEYAGEFRTFAGVSTDSNNVGSGIPQFDFEVILDNTKWHDYFPTYQIINLDKQYFSDQPFISQILKKDLDGCNAYYAKILKDKVKVWEYTYVSSCIMGDPPHEIESIIDVPKNKEPIMLSEPGEYLIKIRIGDYTLQEKFWVQENRVPEPESEKNFPIPENCGSGTRLQDGICVANEQPVKNNSTGIWGTILEFPSKMSPLKQFKSGVPFSEIKCNGNLQLTQKYDDSPACVKPEHYFELIKRGWVSDLILAVQSRDVFLDPEDATSSYMDKITPTLDDFKDVLSETYTIDTLFSKFGKPHDDIGSGIHIYVYELNDSTKIWIGYTDHIWYVKHVDSNGNILEELFVETNYTNNPYNNELIIYQRDDFAPLEYDKTKQVLDETFLSKTVAEWQKVSRDTLMQEHEKYLPEHQFFDHLGKFLIKNEFQNIMNELDIVNTEDDFEVKSGTSLTSLPPHNSYYSIIKATDGNYYRFQGGTHANEVNIYKVSTLLFFDTSVDFKMEDLVKENQLFTIMPENNNNPEMEPHNLIIHTDNSEVEFYNNTPEVIRIQDSGTGKVGEEHLLDWVGPTILPYTTASMTFDEPGNFDFDARFAPNLENPLWWSTHTGGTIIVMSDDMSSVSREEKNKMAQSLLFDLGLPVVGAGTGNAENVLSVSLDPSVVESIPNAKQYYTERIEQIFPFEVIVVME